MKFFVKFLIALLFSALFLKKSFAQTHDSLYVYILKASGEKIMMRSSTENDSIYFGDGKYITYKKTILPGLTKEEFLKADSLMLNLKGYNILEFTFIRSDSSGIKYFKATGNKFSELAKFIVTDSCNVTINEIKIQKPDKTILDFLKSPVIAFDIRKE